MFETGFSNLLQAQRHKAKKPLPGIIHSQQRFSFYPDSFGYALEQLICSVPVIILYGTGLRGLFRRFPRI